MRRNNPQHYLESMQFYLLLQLLNLLTVEDIIALSSVSYSMRRIVRLANSKASFPFWQRKYQLYFSKQRQHFPNASAQHYFDAKYKANTHKLPAMVTNWYEAFTKCYSYNYWYLAKPVNNQFPTRIARIVSMIRENKLDDLKKFNVKMDDLLLSCQGYDNSFLPVSIVAAACDAKKKNIMKKAVSVRITNVWRQFCKDRQQEKVLAGNRSHRRV